MHYAHPELFEMGIFIKNLIDDLQILYLLN